MKINKIISGVLLTISVTSCATFTKLEKEQIMTFVNTQQTQTVVEELKNSKEADNKTPPNLSIENQRLQEDIARLTEQNRKLDEDNQKLKKSSEVQTATTSVNSIRKDLLDIGNQVQQIFYNQNQQSLEAIKNKLESIDKNTLNNDEKEYFDVVEQAYKHVHRQFILSR